MMTKTEIGELIGRLNQEHSYDRDGGYGLVTEISKLINRLASNEQKQLREYLLELIANQDQELWGVALEVLTEDGSPDTSVELDRLLRSGKRTQEWTYHVILALMRLGYSKALDIYLAFIQSGISQHHSVAILLANLYRVDADLATKLSAQFFAAHLSSENEILKAERYVPVFVHTFAEKGDAAFQQLIDQTSANNHKAGERLKGMIIDYLTKPWIIKKWGERASQIRAVLEAGGR